MQPRLKKMDGTSMVSLQKVGIASPTRVTGARKDVAGKMLILRRRNSFPYLATWAFGGNIDVRLTSLAPLSDARSSFLF